MTTHALLILPIVLLAACSPSENGCDTTWYLGDATTLDCPDVSDTDTAGGDDSGTDTDEGPSGKQVVESDESYAELDADYALVTSTLEAQDVGMVAGPGFIDTFEGTIDFDPSASGWYGNDADAYSFTVPAEMIVTLTGGWNDVAADMDFGIFGAYQDYGLIDWFSSFGDSYCLTGANPEICQTEVPLQPDVQYYLVVLGYLGTGTERYDVELEWTAP
jgi:hypothetical protein